MADREFTCDWVSHLVAEWRLHLSHLRGAPAQGLEIGIHEGRSAIWFLENILIDPGSRLTCVDVWHHEEFETRFRANIAPFTERVTVVKTYSAAALRSLPVLHYDFVRVDGAHEALNTLEDAVLSWRLLKVGGVMIFDDYEYHSEHRVHLPKRAVDAFVELYPVTLLHKGSQVIVRKDKENHSYHD